MKNSIAVLALASSLMASAACAAAMNPDPLGLKSLPQADAANPNVAELRLGGVSVADYLDQSLGLLRTLLLERRVSQQLSLGVQVSRASAHTSAPDGFGNAFSFKSSHTTIMGRASYHLADVIDDDRVDLYGGGTLGYNLYSASTFGLASDAQAATRNFVSVGAFTGGRFWFSRNLGLIAELGYQYGMVGPTDLAGTAWGSASVGLSCRF